ncbi:MAG: thioredoxin family protein [Gemmatales bacterium]|nr:thioredoxin family protein [Gemmatales bacterium]MDW8221723.1 thioredoxin family protein [Gemmatales bacterium]
MLRYAFALMVSASLIGLVHAGQFNKKLKIGDPCPTFQNLDGVDGKKHSLSDYKDKDVLVIVITCNHCPVAQAYEDRIIQFTRKWCTGADSKVALVAINVNNLEADKLPAMITRAKERGFNFPYLYDPSQKIARDLGASVTPEFFVFNKARKLVYMGALDDNMNNPKVNYLEAAVEAILKGSEPAVKETKARGCTVKYDAN